MQTARNIAIIMLLALAVAFVPGGDAAANTILNLLAMAFLATIAWFVYVFYRERKLTVDTLRDSRKAILYGALGLICLCIAATDQFTEWGGGAMVGWIVLLAVAVFAIVAVWREATTYS